MSLLDWQDLDCIDHKLVDDIAFWKCGSLEILDSLAITGALSFVGSLALTG